MSHENIIPENKSPNQALLNRLSEITQELCADYPNITTAEPWEQLYALEQSYRGVLAACNDLHAVIKNKTINTQP